MLDIANREQQFLLANRAYANYSTLTSSGYVLPTELVRQVHAGHHGRNVHRAGLHRHFHGHRHPGQRRPPDHQQRRCQGLRFRLHGLHQMVTHPFPTSQRGASMIEVLVTMVIIAFGLLGMAGLQSRMQVAEVEAYQRAQALILLNDMANRLATNRYAAASLNSYVTGSAIDPSTNCATTYAGTSMVETDLKEWCNALQGAAETQGASKVGAVIGGRGCVQSLGNREFLVTVAWQGIVPLSAPPATVPCGQNQYNGSSTSPCVNDLCRRVVTTVVRISLL